MSNIPSVSATEVHAEASNENPPIIIDVREDKELATVSIPGAMHIPLAMLPRKVGRLDLDGQYVLMCHHGTRSAQATELMLRQGFTNVRNMTGGIDAWATDVDTSLARY